MKIFLQMMMALMALPLMMGAQTRYAGGDVSLLPEYQKAGAKYFDHDGRPIADFLPWCAEQGMNAMRVRLFVNPDKYKDKHQNDTDTETKYDPNACQDLEYILPLCQEIVNAGLDLVLDFHYSDTWADPAKQWTPIDWEGLTDSQLYDKIYEYTRETLLTLKEAGVTPKFIQPGNEISYGMLWGPLGTSSPKKTYMGNSANWERLGKLLNRAIEACREVCPEAKIIIHTERVAQVNVLSNFYGKMAELNVDYDIIGLSYYPVWHGTLSVLNNALSVLEAQYPQKNIMIVETGYGLKWQIPGASIDTTNTWPISDAGQAKFAQDLVDALEKHSTTDGLFWWWMEYNPYNTSLGGWYNAPLFDPTTGRASSAFKIICSYATPEAGIGAVNADSASEEQWYDLMGRPVGRDARGIVIKRGSKYFR